MLTSKTELEEILAISPEWRVFLQRIDQAPVKRETPPTLALFEQVGGNAIYNKLRQMQGADNKFIDLIRNFYYQPLFARMLIVNQNLKRFWVQRRVAPDVQKRQCISLSVELAQKMQNALVKQLSEKQEDGFKVLLPAYAQRSVHNAVVDYVRREWQWEKETLQDLNLDPSMADPRSQVPDQVEYSPEHQAISSEQVGQLNQVRAKLEEMLGNKRYPKDALTVVDCMFGLGLTEKSQEGIEMTMRECCEALALKGDTQARQIARCQVLLDKGLDLVREMIRTDMPGVAQAWQSDVNINSASRRELNHNLGLTEGEVDRLLSSRQYYSLDELIDKKVIKPERLPEIVEKGAVAAFVPVDLNNATRRDIIDICGADKTVSKKIVDMRPFASLDELLTKKILDPKTLGLLVEKGAVLKKQEAGPIRININKAEAEELQKLGLTDAQAQRLSRARPFGTWDELETFLCVDDNTWKAIRENACLSNNPT